MAFCELALAEVPEEREELGRVDSRSDQTGEPAHEYGQDVPDIQCLGVVQVLEQVRSRYPDQALAFTQKVHIDQFPYINVNLLRWVIIRLLLFFYIGCGTLV